MCYSFFFLFFFLRLFYKQGEGRRPNQKDEKRPPNQKGGGRARSRGRGSAQASADDIHCARGSEAGNSDRVLWSVQGERGVLSGRNPSSTAQGEGVDGVQRARSAPERGRVRGKAEKRARGKGRKTSNRPDPESERGRDGGAQGRGQSSVARPAVCTADVMDRLRITARTSVAAGEDAGQ